MSDRREGKREKRTLSESSVGNLGIGYDVKEHHTTARENEVSALLTLQDKTLFGCALGRAAYLYCSFVFHASLSLL